MWIAFDGTAERGNSSTGADAPETGSALRDFQAQARRECSAADLEAALDQLPAEIRLVLLLVDGEGMRYEEVHRS
jgi:DNA-directed RNA polymerase specialized sigma24 family protein